MCRRLIHLVCLASLLGLPAGVANADITTGLVGYYPLDEGAGNTAYDMSGNGHNGTLHNGVTWISQGFIGGAVNVDGTTNTRIELGTWNPAEGTGQLSLALWIRWAGGGFTYQGLIGKRDTWPATTMFQFQVRPENNGTFRLETGTYAVVSPSGTLAPFVQTWAHVAATFDGTTARLYLNGEEITSGAFAFNTAGETSNMGIGCVTGGGAGYSGNGEVFLGDIDEVYIYNRALSEIEILGVMEGGGEFPFAFGPTPEDGALVIEFPGGILGTSLSWKPGDFAVSHDVYFGQNFDDVRDGTGGTFRGNQTETYFFVGYGSPNDPAPTGLVRGTTYYWRIDEVNDTEPNSPWKGNVWSFSIPDTKAYGPSPANGSRFMDRNTNLSWKKGLGAIAQTVYFGDDYDTVSNTTTGGNPVAGATTYDPGLLEYEKVYYWRVDSTGVYGEITGDVWSFKTTSPYVGVRAEYYHWVDPTVINTGDPGPADPFQTFVMTRIESEIDHHWGAGSPDPLVDVDQFAGRWTAELEAPSSEPYTFWTVTDDGVRVWLDGELIIDDWFNHGDTWNSSQPIDLVAGQRYALVTEWYENAGGATAELDWESPSMPRQVIPAGPLQLPLRATSPDPSNGATGVKETPTLKWTAGEQAAQHDVYFGTDPDAVASANTSTVGIYRGRQDGTSYVPTEAPLEWDQTYYWKIDEVNGVDLWEGSLWSFTTADYLIVDDFEDYDDFCNRIFYTWGDGWGHNGDVSCGVPPYGGNGTGSTVGYLREPYAEQSIIHTGTQSMPFEYLNDGSTGKALYAETERTFDPPQNWVKYGVHDLKALTLWFRGTPASVGSFSYDPVTGIYTMTAAGEDIWDVPDFPGAGVGNFHDEFHYAYKRLSGQGAIVANVLSVSNTNAWAKAGVMIRETLDANSVHAMVVVTPGQGVSFQRRTAADEISEQTAEAGIQAPHWVRLTRSGNDFTAEHSTDGATWDTIGTENIPMAANPYVGLALTSHNTDPTVVCRGTFSDVSITGTVTGQWQSQDIGITSNDAEQLYVAVEDSTGKSEVARHPDPYAVQLSTWQQWNIDLKQFSDGGVNLQSVRKMYIGVGDRDAPKVGGAGMLYVDDIRLYQSRCLPSLAKPAGDFNNNCVVDYPDLDIMTDNWLMTDYGVTPTDPGTGNLVAYYALENNTNDGSGNDHHGDPCGAPTYVTGPAGYGTAMHFDGTGIGNYVDLGTFDPSAATGELTVAVWAKWDGLTSYWQGLVAKRDTWTATDMMWQLEADVNTGTLGFFRYGGPYFANGALPVGQWTHVAVSFDGTAVSFYVNAEMTGSGPFSFGPDTEARVVFGAVEANGGNPFNGALDEVRIYDRGLTQGQVAWLAGKTTTYTQPLYLLLTPQDGTIDMNSDGMIDLKDYAVLADTWLDEVLWP